MEFYPKLIIEVDPSTLPPDFPDSVTFPFAGLKRDVKKTFATKNWGNLSWRGINKTWLRWPVSDDGSLITIKAVCTTPKELAGATHESFLALMDSKGLTEDFKDRMRSALSGVTIIGWTWVLKTNWDDGTSGRTVREEVE